MVLSEINIHPNHRAETLHRVAVVEFIFLAQDIVQFQIQAEGVVQRVSTGQVELVDVVHLFSPRCSQESLSAG